jgi:hypothetical protein
MPALRVCVSESPCARRSVGSRFQGLSVDDRALALPSLTIPRHLQPHACLTIVSNHMRRRRLRGPGRRPVPLRCSARSASVDRCKGVMFTDVEHGHVGARATSRIQKLRKGQLNRHTRYRPATTTRNTDQTKVAKGLLKNSVHSYINQVVNECAASGQHAARLASRGPTVSAQRRAAA